MDLIALVDRALTTGSAPLMGSAVIDSAAMLKRCQHDKPPDLGRGADARRGAYAEAFATCLSLVDWSKARRLGLDYGSGIGRPPRSCGFHKHEVAHLYYDVSGQHVSVDLDAFSYAGRYAVTLPLACRVNHKGWTVADREESLAGEDGKNRGRCPGAGWPIVRDVGGHCPPPRRQP